MRYVKSAEVYDEDDNMATAVIRFSERMEVLSSAPLNGGNCLTDTVFMMQVPHKYDGDYLKDLVAKRDQYKLPHDSVGFMTAAEVKYVFSQEDDPFGEDSAFVAATAGVTNAIRAGEELDRWEERSARSAEIYKKLIAGTINIVAVSPYPMTLGAKINMMMPIVEGKAMAMSDLGYTETGTTSDAVAVVSPVGDDRIAFAGTGTPLGLAVAKGARKAVAECLRKRGESPEPESVMRMLSHRGVTEDEVWDCASALGMDESTRRDFFIMLDTMGSDPDVCSLVCGMLHAGRMADAGCIMGQEGLPDVMTDGTFAMFLAGRISEDRGKDDTIDLMRMRPLKDSGLPEYIEDTIYGLVAGTVGYITGYSDE